MSQAGIFDLPNREDSNSPEVPALEGESSELPQTAEIPAVERFEQRITPDGTPGNLSGERRPRLKEADWFSLARKLRQRNRDLLKKVAQLEQSLESAQESLQVEIARSRSIDVLNHQQVRELEAARTKISWLYGELEASHQAARERSRSAEQLSQELEATSDRIVALERECTLLQQHCNEQSHRVEIAEQLGRDLAARLECQQHRTLQFKAALDKCLERSTSEMLCESEATTSAPPEAIAETVEPPASPKTQPIQPWSSLESSGAEFADDLSDWAEQIPHQDSPEPNSSLEEPAIEGSQEEPDLQPLPDSEPLEVPSLQSFEPIEWEVEPSDSDTFDAIFETLEEPSELTIEGESEFDIASATEELPAFSLEQTLEVISPRQSNFPAPLVYPHRRERKHRSLATIELPNFRH